MLPGPGVAGWVGGRAPRWSWGLCTRLRGDRILRLEDVHLQRNKELGTRARDHSRAEEDEEDG